MLRALEFTVLSLPLSLLACASPVDEVAVAQHPQRAHSALLASDDDVDQLADHGCRVVLRAAQRVHDESQLVLRDGAWVWQAIVDVDERLVRGDGAEPALLARMAPSGEWQLIGSPEPQGGAAEGFSRFAFTLDRSALGLPAPGWSTTSIARARVEVAPFIDVRGQRLFDHNAPDVAGDLEARALTNAEAFTYEALPTTCAAPREWDETALAPHLYFRADGSLAQFGRVSEGPLVVEYDVDRLTRCRARQFGREAWSVSATARFLPSDDRQTIQVVGPSQDGSMAMATPAHFDVPPHTTSVELWFQSTSVFGCLAWDSNRGENHRFEVLRRPGWSGNVRVVEAVPGNRRCDAPSSAELERDDDGDGERDDIVIDDAARAGRTSKDLCVEVWFPGVTDRSESDLGRALDVQALVRFGDGAIQARDVVVVGRAHNNARFALPAAALDPFARACPGHLDERFQRAGKTIGRARAEVSFRVNGVPTRGDVELVFEGVVDAGCEEPDETP